MTPFVFIRSDDTEEAKEMACGFQKNQGYLRIDADLDVLDGPILAQTAVNDDTPVVIHGRMRTREEIAEYLEIQAPTLVISLMPCNVEECADWVLVEETAST